MSSAAALATSGPARIGFADLGHQAGTFGQVVERLPQGIGQDADEYMGLGAAAVLVPDGPQEQFAFENPESTFDHRELDVGFPEFLGRPASLVGEQQVGPVRGQSFAKLARVPDIELVGIRCHSRDLHERAGLGKAALEPADGSRILSRFLSYRGRPSVQLFQALCQTATLAAANGPFLSASRPAPRQQIVRPSPLEQLDLDLGVVGQLRAKPGNATRSGSRPARGGVWTTDNGDLVH